MRRTLQPASKKDGILEQCRTSIPACASCCYDCPEFPKDNSSSFVPSFPILSATPGSRVYPGTEAPPGSLGELFPGSAAVAAIGARAGRGIPPTRVDCEPAEASPEDVDTVIIWKDLGRTDANDAAHSLPEQNGREQGTASAGCRFHPRRVETVVEASVFSSAAATTTFTLFTTRPRPFPARPSGNGFRTRPRSLSSLPPSRFG